MVSVVVRDRGHMVLPEPTLVYSGVESGGRKGLRSASFFLNPSCRRRLIQKETTVHRGKLRPTVCMFDG
jgi:hypothetical protein